MGIQCFFPLLIYCSRILYLESGPFHSKVRFECLVVVPWYVILIKPFNTMIEQFFWTVGTATGDDWYYAL